MSTLAPFDSSLITFDRLDDGGITIQETTGDRRTIRLVDRAMPMRQAGMRFEIEHAVNTDWIQGSPVATQQPQGPELKETSFSGSWHDRYIDADPPMATVALANGAPQAVSSARDLSGLLFDVCRKGQVVRFTYLWIVRVGILKRFSFDPKTPNDVDWEATFEWQADGDAAARPSSVVSRDHGARAREVSGAAAAVDQASDFQVAVAPLDPDAIGALGTLVTSLGDSAQAAEDAAFGASDGVLGPVESALGTAGALGTVADNAEAVAESIYARTARDYMRVGDVLDQAGLDGQDVLAVASDLWTTIVACRETTRAATRHRRALARQAQGGARLVVRARQGDDLRSLLQREVGDAAAADWVDVADYNGLSGSTLETGQKVAIPHGQKVLR